MYGVLPFVTSVVGSFCFLCLVYPGSDPHKRASRSETGVTRGRDQKTPVFYLACVDMVGSTRPVQTRLGTTNKLTTASDHTTQANSLYSTILCVF